MTIFIKKLKDLETVAYLCNVNITPEAQAKLDVLERIKKPLEKKGWEITIYNQGTNTVSWRFMKKGTKRTVCRVVNVIPIAHYPQPS